MSRFAIAVFAVLVVPGSALLTAGGAAAQDADESEGSFFSVLLMPYAGVADNPRELKLPVAPMAGMRVTGEVWSTLPKLPIRFAPFLGASGSILAVNTEDGLEIEYLTMAEGGIKLDVRGQPYLVGFIGRAYPVANQTYDLDLRKWVGGDSLVFGGGVGLSPMLGRSAFNIEGRYRRDRRFEAHLDESFEILVGFPTWIGIPR